LLISANLGSPGDPTMAWVGRGLSLGVAAGVFWLALRSKPLFDAFLGHLGENRILGIALSGLLGLVIPMCECGIIPVTRRLLRKGLPLSCCVAYILTGPIINFVVLLSTYVAFFRYPPEQMGGPWMMILRAGLAFLVAFFTALVVERLHRKHGDELLTPLAKPKTPLPSEEENGTGAPLPFWKRVGNVSETALHDFVDITLYLILGSLFAALTCLLIPKDQVAEWSQYFPISAIAVMMLLAVLLCLCSEADAFVAASFSTMPAAKLGFLVLGPMLDLKLFLMYRTMFRPRLIATIFGCVTVLCFVFTVIMHYVWTAYFPMPRG
jgi:hypothetical protein